MVTTAADLQTMSLDDAASVLGISRSTLYKHAKADSAICGIPIVKVGTRMRVPRDRLMAVARGEQPAPTPAAAVAS